MATKTMQPGHPHTPCAKCGHPFHCHPIAGMLRTPGTDHCTGCECKVEILMVAVIEED